MNNIDLQKNFPENYKVFFSRNDLVLSWCFTFPWWPSWIWERSNYITCKSKIPLKCYVWFKFKKETWIIFKNVEFYNLVLKKFEIYPYDKINKEKEKITQFINIFLENNNFDKGIEIEFLSETSRWHSFWFTWTSSAIISLWLSLLTWNLDINYQQNYNDFILSEEFKNIEIFASKIAFISKYWNSIWQNIRHTLHNNKDPSFFFWEKIKDLTLEKIESIKTNFYKIWEKCWENLISTHIPFDYYMFFSWITTDSKQVVNYIKWNEKRYWDYSTFINDFIIWNDFKWIDTNLSKYTLNNNLVYDLLTENINILWIKTIELFKKLFENWYDNNLIEDFIEHINNYKNAVSIIEKQSSFTDDFAYIFRKNKSNLEEQIWIMPAYSWKFWWWYVVITKPWISRNTIDKTINELKNIYPNVEIEYCSFIDWESSDGILVEQYISEWIYSNYVDTNKVLYKNNKWEIFLWEYNEILEKEKEWLLLDTIWNKIYFNWIKLTSKDIPSQNTTIEVLIKLIDNTEKDISNKELPVSSYTKNKNEMLGKIVIPLINFIEEKTKQKLPLVCKWSLNDFYIKIWKVNINIWVIKKF